MHLSNHAHDIFLSGSIARNQVKSSAVDTSIHHRENLFIPILIAFSLSNKKTINPSTRKSGCNNPTLQNSIVKNIHKYMGGFLLNPIKHKRNPTDHGST